MNGKIGRNDPCICGSGRKYKKCCMGNDGASSSLSWQDSEGAHFVNKGESPSNEKLEKMTKEYQEQIRNSPMWDDMVQKHGKEKAEELLLQFEVKLGD